MKVRRQLKIPRTGGQAEPPAHVKLTRNLPLHLGPLSNTFKQCTIRNSTSNSEIFKAFFLLLQISLEPPKNSKVLMSMATMLGLSDQDRSTNFEASDTTTRFRSSLMRASSGS